MSTAMVVQDARKLADPASGLVSLAVMPGDTPDAPPVTGLVKLGPDGAFAKIAVNVPLTLQNKGVWKFRGALVPTALGLDKANQYLGASFISPDTVLNDAGVAQPNPHYERNAEGDLLWVRIRSIGTWINALGIRVIYDLTLDFDLKTYFAQDLYAKWFNKERAPRGWGRLAPSLDRASLKANEKAYRLPDGLVLVVDITNAEYQACVSEQIGRLKFAGRLAGTLCRRNILKIAMPHAAILDGTLPVVSWQQTPITYADMRHIVDSSATHKIEHGKAIVSDPSDVTDAAEATTGDDGLPIDAASADAAEEEPRFSDSYVDVAEAKELVKVRAAIRSLCAELDDKVVDTVLGAAGLAGLEEVGQTGDIPLLNTALAELQNAKMAQLQQAGNSRQGAKR